MSSGEAEPQAGSAPASLLSEEDILREAGAAFSDGIITGFCINSYTTNQCPTLEGVLEEMRRGLERLQDQAPPGLVCAHPPKKAPPQ